MKNEDYAEEYKRRLEHRFPKAENQPDPTRRKVVWDEELQTHIYLSEVANPYKIDRGEA